MQPHLPAVYIPVKQSIPGGRAPIQHLPCPGHTRLVNELTVRDGTTNLITAYQHNYIPDRFSDYFRRYAGVRKELRMLATRITGQVAPNVTYRTGHI